MKWQIVCKLVMVLPMKSSTIDLAFIKFVQDGSQKPLIVLHKQTRLDICQQNLDRHGKEGDAILVKVITGDEKWVRHYEPECKRQVMEWKHPQSPIMKKF